MTDALEALQLARQQGSEIILVDGGSSDNTLELAEALKGRKFDTLVKSERGRARQMNAGAKVAANPMLIFLHIDTLLAERCIEDLNSLSTLEQVWGFFHVSISGEKQAFRIIEKMMNFRSRLSGVATGDQAIFINKAFFEQVGGFADVPLMEDVELSKRLKKIHRPVVLSSVVYTSSRKWDEGGIFKTLCLMWSLRLAYFVGVSPARLVKFYYKTWS